jgi:hypothetical protein
VGSGSPLVGPPASGPLFTLRVPLSIDQTAQTGSYPAEAGAAGGSTAVLENSSFNQADAVVCRQCRHILENWIARLVEIRPFMNEYYPISWECHGFWFIFLIKMTIITTGHPDTHVSCQGR